MKDGVTSTVRLAFEVVVKMVVVAVNSGKSFSLSDQCSYQETSSGTSDFNHPDKDNVNYIYTDLWAQMMSIQNDCKYSDI